MLAKKLQEDLIAEVAKTNDEMLALYQNFHLLWQKHPQQMYQEFVADMPKSIDNGSLKNVEDAQAKAKSIYLKACQEYGRTHNNVAMENLASSLIRM